MAQAPPNPLGVALLVADRSDWFEPLVRSPLIDFLDGRSPAIYRSNLSSPPTNENPTLLCGVFVLFVKVIRRGFETALRNGSPLPF